MTERGERYRVEGPTRCELARASLLFLALVAVVLAPAAMPGTMPSASGILQAWDTFRVDPPYFPRNDLATDVAVQFEPWTHYARERLRDGRLPLWNPHQAAGVPFIASMQSAVFSPLTWLVYLFGDRWGPLARAAAILYLAGILAYMHLRGLGLVAQAARIGAVGWMFSGGVVHWLFWSASLLAFLLPGVLWSIDRAFREKADPRVTYPALALLVALGITSGQPEFVVLCAFAGAAGLGFRALSSELPARRRLGVAAGLCLAALAGAAMSAPALLSFVEYLRHSAAWALREGGMFVSGLPRSAAVLLLLPDLFGNRALPFGAGWLAPWTNDCEALGGAVGIALPALAVAGLRLRSRTGRFYLILAAVSGALAYGVWPFPWLIRNAPVLDRMAVGRFGMVLAYCVCVLGAASAGDLLAGLWVPTARRLFARLGPLVGVAGALVAWNALHVDRFQGADRLPLWWTACILLAVGTLAVAVLLVRRVARGNRVALILLAALVFVETGVRWMGFTPTVPKAYYFPETAALRSLRETAGDGRFLGLGEGNPVPPNLATRYGLRGSRVYDNLDILHYWMLLAAATEPGPLGNPVRFDPAALDVFGVRAVITESEAVEDLARPGSDASGLVLSAQHGPVRIWRNTRALPRAFFVNSVRGYRTPAAVFERDEHGPVAGRTLLRWGADDRRDPVPDEAPGEVAWLRDEPEDLLLSVDAPTNGHLILLDSYYPGWQASVDGRPAPIVRAQFAFRAVPVPAGWHEVRFRYRPESVRSGAAAGILAVLSICVYVAGCTIRRRAAE